MSPCDQANLFAPFAELHDAVMAEAESLCKVGDCGHHTVPRANNLK
jgi:hypothetical protein